MARDKPRKIVTPKIVQDGGHRSLWLWVFALAALLAWSWQAYRFGLGYAGSEEVGETSGNEELYAQIVDLEQDRERLRFEAARFERSSQIDRQAIENVNARIEALKAERAALRQEADHLRGLVAEGDSNFAIKDFKLRKTGSSNGYAYSFTIAREVEGAKRVEGAVSVIVRGEQNNELVELPMETVASDGTSHHKLGFKQFQSVEGRLVTPEGFPPLELMIDIQITEPSPKALIVSFDWI